MTEMSSRIWEPAKEQIPVPTYGGFVTTNNDNQFDDLEEFKNLCHHGGLSWT